MGRKNRRLARCPHLDRPFHLLQKIAGTAGRSAAALRAKPCAASLFGTTAARSVMPVVTQNPALEDNNPFAFARYLATRFRRMGRKIRGLAGFPGLDGARPVVQKMRRNGPFAAIRAAPLRPLPRRGFLCETVSNRKSYPSPASAGEVPERSGGDGGVLDRLRSRLAATCVSRHATPTPILVRASPSEEGEV